MDQLNILDRVEKDVEQLHDAVSQEIKGPLQSIQDGVHGIQNANLGFKYEIQQLVNLQIYQMEQSRNQHGEIIWRQDANQKETTKQFDLLGSAIGTVSQNQEKTNRKIDVLERKSDELNELVCQAKEEIKKNGGMLLYRHALLKQLSSIQDARSQDDAGISLSTAERAKLARQNDKVSVAIRRISKLAQGCKDTMYIEDDDAQDYLTSIQDLLEVLQESSDGGSSLKRELTQLARRLLGVDSMYVEKAPAAWLNNKFAKRGNVVAKHLYGFKPDTVSCKGFQEERKLENDMGSLVVSCRSEKRTAMSEYEGPIKAQATRLFVRQEPDIERGEIKLACAFKIEDLSGSERAAGLALPLVLRQYNWRSFKPGDPQSPWRMAMDGDLPQLQAVFKSRMVTIYDLDQDGRSLLHAVVETIRLRNKPEEHAKRLEVCKFLIEQGADANVPNKEGKSAINYLRSTVYETQPTFVRLDIAQEAFDQILSSLLKNHYSPYDEEEALAVAIRNLMGGSPWFFDKLLSRLTSSGDLDINNYDGSGNAVMLEFATASTDDIDVLLKNLEIAIKHGGDIHARTRETGESCLHLIVREIRESFNSLETMTCEGQWKYFFNRWLKQHLPRITKMLEFGADVFAIDSQVLMFPDGRNIHYSVTRTMYSWGVQDHWWNAIEDAGYTKDGLMEKEAGDLGVTMKEYETYLEDLAKKTVETLSPASSSRHLWNPFSQPGPETDDGKPGPETHTAYFRGRKLVGTKLVVPDGYQGHILTAPTQSQPPTGSQKKEMLYQDDKQDDEDGEIEETAQWTSTSSFSEIMVWGHEILVDGAQDGVVKGLEEWMGTAQILNGYDGKS
ncbi:hypothetical protein Dda_6182 [Drechslerella dactyloides]|uniref:Ankyrin repeat protein n=1 Tax=Drechslerella dactyloides TaxID=74499 RepID=A0AAD6NJQ1_DREDA|nr:hypothetical protein Dda_6182 [Drechslerella dactyloides]